LIADTAVVLTKHRWGDTSNNEQVLTLQKGHLLAIGNQLHHPFLQMAWPFVQWMEESLDDRCIPNTDKQT
jgi:hypothetical protein